MLPLLISSLLILALVLHILSRRESFAARSIRRRHGIPKGKVIYSDLDRPGVSLFSKKYGIVGKPDYIVKDRASKANIPVEIKSGQAKNPYRNHVLQLAAYCLLVEETFNKPVPYGIIVYVDGKQHKIHFDKTLRSDLLRTIAEMRRHLKDEFPKYKSSKHPLLNYRLNKRGNDHYKRCRFCSLQAECERLQLTGTKTIGRSGIRSRLL